MMRSVTFPKFFFNSTNAALNETLALINYESFVMLIISEHTDLRCLFMQALIAFNDDVL